METFKIKFAETVGKYFLPDPSRTFSTKDLESEFQNAKRLAIIYYESYIEQIKNLSFDDFVKHSDFAIKYVETAKKNEDMLASI